MPAELPDPFLTSPGSGSSAGDPVATYAAILAAREHVLTAMGDGTFTAWIEGLGVDEGAFWQASADAAAAAEDVPGSVPTLVACGIAIGLRLVADVAAVRAGEHADLVAELTTTLRPLPPPAG